MKKLLSYPVILLTAVMLTSCSQTLKTGPLNTPNEGSKKDIINNNETEKKQDNETDKTGAGDIEGHTGIYALIMSGYKGEINIEFQDGKFTGTIKFFNWGNGVPQPLTDLRITGNKIYFKRIIRTREDLIKYGGTAYFEQDFYGIFSEDKKKIKGYYRYAGTQDGWKADKKQ